MQHDDRVGVWVNGKRVYPRVTLSNRTFTLPATTTDIDDEHFVVLDIFPPKGFDAAAEIEQIRAALSADPEAALETEEVPQAAATGEEPK